MCGCVDDLEWDGGIYGWRWAFEMGLLGMGALEKEPCNIQQNNRRRKWERGVIMMMIIMMTMMMREESGTLWHPGGAFDNG